MSLPLKAIDRLFDRMALTYGSAWEKSLGTAPVMDIKTVWAHELSGFGDKLSMVAWALENLPERAPNVIEFRNLCRKAPAPEAPRLPEPQADQERLKAELSKLCGVIKETPPFTYNPKGWAHRIMQRQEDGEMVKPTTLRFAKEALRYA